MTLCDAGPLVALVDADERDHARCRAALPALPGPLLRTGAISSALSQAARRDLRQPEERQRCRV